MTRVLIVEDDKNVAQTLQLFCQEFKADCGHAASISEALDYLKKEKPDIILLDILLGPDQGTVLIKKVEEIFGHEGPEIVIMSAHSQGSKIAKEYGVKFLAKPFDIDSLETLITYPKSNRLK